MAVTRDSFVIRFPEFIETPESLVNKCLEEAELMVDRTVFREDLGDLAVRAYAAHLIAINPLGELARLGKCDCETQYSKLFDRIKRRIGAGFRVL